MEAGECSFHNDGCGIVYEITPAGVEMVLHLFKDEPDGAFPAAALIEGSDGNLYGTTDIGGATGGGTVFKFTGPIPDGSSSKPNTSSAVERVPQ